METIEMSKMAAYKLSSREQEVVSLLVKGMKIKDIASTLNIKSNTVSTIKKNIYYKLEVRNFVDLLKITLEHSI
ncbi:MAG: helix-turn-helix transcriptional regulator [Sediminibacterium sp.]|jgi:DNA-binding NarL/FixJ family response regulator